VKVSRWKTAMRRQHTLEIRARELIGIFEARDHLLETIGV
jgi:ribosomal protein L32